MNFLLLLLLPLFLFAVPHPPDRPPSAPYISGDTFRFYADFAFDELTTLNPAEVHDGATLFVKTDYLKKFFETIHPAIQHPYILITHNSDDPAPGPYAHFLDDPKIIAWFGQNFDGTAHPKMHPIPIGLANSHWKHGKFQQLEEIKARQLPKKHLVYLNIIVQTYAKERKRVFDYFSSLGFCYHKKGRSYPKFLKDVATSQFIVSPRGNGLDTHRLWESLYLGSIPIVKTSSLDPLYKDLPVLIVSEWEEVTESFLKQKALEFSSKKVDLAPLTIDYWLAQIELVRSSARNSSDLK